MKRIFLTCIYVFGALVLQSCWDSEIFPGDGEVAPVELEVTVTNETTSEAVEGATVDIYASVSDFLNESNVVASKTTDAAGVVVFSKSELGGEPASFIVSASSGELRNWNNTTGVPAMTMTAGKTVFETQLGSLPPGFIYLSSNTFQFTAYTYQGSNYLPACETNDLFLFQKNGEVWRFDGDNVCADPTGFQLPLYNLTEEANTTWSLSADGSTITTRDFDPTYDASGVDAGLTIDEANGMLYLDYGSDFVAEFTIM